MAGTSAQLSDSLEDYMEAIFHIEMKKHAARAKDIAERLQVSNSSVTGALRLLSEKGLVNYAPYDIITLTVKGKKVAQRVVWKHQTLRNFFVDVLGVDPEQAEETACKMEHGVSKLVLERIHDFSKFLEQAPPEYRAWLDSFKGKE
ncbi:DtxR family transcriptional regulator [candidate division KSB3 bacterium]|uniref:DtxR family transcriptional regulator n=1 Tax=candidate division KSB3 bacterium TaxID=2044937 RepID=A0A2G6E394_9BACT|nr:MAG: DtxR family transcriptional regulator [candidate division KSB3 bacterium]PIE29049.1 MAG: DtxR family transcriptional regulator [candidate division KSB3 bacterium]